MLPKGSTVAVIGPFANCSDTIGGGWAKTNCYLHSYAGIPSSITSILDAMQEDVASLGGKLLFGARSLAAPSLW